MKYLAAIIALGTALVAAIAGWWRAARRASTLAKTARDLAIEKERTARLRAQRRAQIEKMRASQELDAEQEKALCEVKGDDCDFNTWLDDNTAKPE